MTTHTHTRTGLSKWEIITMAAIAAFVIGLVGKIITNFIDADWASVIEMLFMLATYVGLIMSFISAPKVFGGLKTGITAVVTGAVFFIIGGSMLEQVGSDAILGVEFPHFSDPMYIIGYPLNTFGILLFIVGSIVTVVTYLRRLLKAVEGKASAPN